ncbi:MAG: DUF1080 domain-containing protein [Gemmatimonadota bacterium]
MTRSRHVRRLRNAAVLALVFAFACTTADGREDRGGDGRALPPQEASNMLSDDEAASGFTLLFDGQSLDAWRGFNRDDVPGGWSAVDGAIVFTPDVEGGDLITRETFEDFELRLEWRIGPSGNSGVFFGVIEGNRRTYESGPEMQILDNAGHPDGRNLLTSAGSNYGLHAPLEDVTRPVGEWNEARIVRAGDHVEHWFNGSKIVEYEIGTDEWKAMVAETKFADWPDYGAHREGHIGLQDHGDPVQFRNLRIRRLDRTATDTNP